MGVAPRASVSNPVGAPVGLVSRKDARANGMPHYITGKPCPKGHIGLRRVSNRACIECSVFENITQRAKMIKAEWRSANQDKIKASNKRLAAKNSKKATERARAWAEANPERRRATARNWAAANSENVKANTRNRRARIRGCEGRHTQIEIRSLFLEQDGLCANVSCAQSISNGFEADHIRPIALGGDNWITNIQLLCRTCNRKKSKLDPAEWARRLEAVA